MKIEIEIPEEELTEYLVTLMTAKSGNLDDLDECDKARIQSLKDQIQEQAKKQIQSRFA